MHDDQLAIGVGQVRALITDQCPALARLPIVEAEAVGTVHAIFRVGDAVAARFPLRPADPDLARRRLTQEAGAAAEFARASPVPAPTPLYVGRPGHGYPSPWATQTWLSGVTATSAGDAHRTSLALDLADLVGHLRHWDRGGRSFGGLGRGGDLADHDPWMDECIARSAGLADRAVLRQLWTRFRALPREDPDVMAHGDLIPANLLVERRRLVGVLDTGGFGPADPALDLVVAWHLFDDERRDELRRALDCGDLQWERGMAWAFHQAIGALWYYRGTNPTMAELGRTTLDRLVAAWT